MCEHDYLKLYDLESYLFDTVSPAFDKDGKINAFDFFCIIIWKANRAKSKIAQKLLEQDSKNRKDLNPIVEELTASLHGAKDDEERMRILFDQWKFPLPTASAILTVLYPESFTLYDARVCGVIGGDFDKLKNKSQFGEVWSGYQRFIKEVRQAPPSGLSLRDKDRYLWGKSFVEGLNKLTKSWPTMRRGHHEKNVRKL